MNNLRQPFIRPVFRRWMLAILLLCTLAVSGYAVQKYRQTTDPDPRIVVRTDAEAEAAVRRFFTAVQWPTAPHNLASAPVITTDRSKGQKVWRVAWPALTDPTPQTDLAALVSEVGWLYTGKTTGENTGVSVTAQLIAGVIKFIQRSGYRLEWSK
jgi:hypothetical protein